jgi:hypothetical protein
MTKDPFWMTDEWAVEVRYRLTENPVEREVAFTGIARNIETALAGVFPGGYLLDYEVSIYAHQYIIRGRLERRGEAAPDLLKGTANIVAQVQRFCESEGLDGSGYLEAVHFEPILDEATKAIGERMRGAVEE